MKCDKIKELILTDYVDGQLEAAEKVRLEEHLKACSACHEFAQTVQKELVTPFADLDRPEVPPAVWQNIRTAIAPEEDVEPAWSAVIRFLGNLQALRPAALLMAGAVIIIALTAILMKPVSPPDQIVQQPVVQPRLAAQSSQPPQEEPLAETYLAEIDDDYGDVFELADGGYGTAIEEYFL